METKQCPVCWGKGVICVALTANGDPILEPCTGCNGTGWLTYGNLLKEGERGDKVITDNIGETLVIGWDGTRFILSKQSKFITSLQILFLNPKEAQEVVKFIKDMGGD